jgi:FAD/FMN-containing dehydrogenase
VVTGDGQLRRVTAEADPDLFWAFRGGKGSLGIVTALEFDLIRQPEIYGGALYFDGADAAAVLHAWRTWSADLPEAATTSIAIMQLPPMPAVPEPLAGRMTVSVRFAHTGDQAEGKDLLEPMREAAVPVLDAVGVLPFAAIGAVHSDPVDPMPTHEDTDILRELTAETIDALLAVAGPRSGSPQVIVELRQLAGAAAAPGAFPDAVSRRVSGTHTLMVIGALAPPIARIVPEHCQAVRAAIAPWATGFALPNFGSGVGGKRLSRVYDEPTLDRLAELARRYDPKHVLRAGQVPVR